MIYQGVNTITPVATRQGIDIESISAQLQTQQDSVVITQSQSPINKSSRVFITRINFS